MICRTCRDQKAPTEFAFKDKARGTRHSQCKECQNEGWRKFYRKNRKRRLAYECVLKRNRRKRISEAVSKLKDRPCADCGNKYPPCVMDFDHINGKKVNAIAALSSAGRSLKFIESEIKKCELVCSNCHRIRTHERKTGHKGR